MEVINQYSDAPIASPGNRLIAAIIDGLIIGALFFIPVAGWFAGLAYELVKDALPFLDGQSIGKKAMKIRVVNYETREPITEDYGAAVIRAVVLMIPILGFIDMFMVFAKDGRRFGDQWANTIVISEA